MQAPFQILIVEDNPLDAEIIQRLLQKTFQDPQIGIVTNSREFQNHVLKHPPDVILSDNSLPRFSATEALKMAKEMVPYTPFILVTGTVSEEYAAEMIKNGADDYILKDRMTRLPAAIEAAAAKRQAAKETEKYLSLLAQSQASLQTIFDNTSEGFVLLDKELQVKAFNHRAKQLLFSYIHREIIVGQHILELVEQSRLEFFKSVVLRALGGEVVEYERSFTDHTNQHWVHFSFRPVFKDAEVTGICLTGSDITVRKMAEELLTNSLKENRALAERFSAIVNTLPANIALLNEEGIIVEVNESWKNFADSHGYTGSGYGVGESYFSLAESAGQTLGLPGKTEVAESLLEILHQKKHEMICEYGLPAASGKKWFRLIITSLLSQAYRGAVAMHVDISEVKKLENERLENNIREQKRIARAILNAQEKERNAIGIELHDNVNQILVGTNLLLTHARDNAEDNASILSMALENLKQAIAENRKIAHEFVAPDLETQSLSDQLHRLCQSMLSPSGVTVELDTSKLEEALLDRERKFNVYRIAQEQCTNIVKYAKATVVAIRLETTGGNFNMSVKDNGVGMPADQKPNGIGLRNIRHRLSLFNGTAEIITSSGHGFCLLITLPLQEAGY